MPVAGSPNWTGTGPRKQKAGAFAPALSIQIAQAYSAATILPPSHLNSEKLGEVRSPVSP